MALNYFLNIGLFLTLTLGQINSHPIDIIYTGRGCHCEKTLPYEVKIPVPNPPSLPGLPKYHGYRVEVPAIKKQTKFEYSLDFEVEKPIPPLPPKPFTPKDLYARVDRIALEMPDCPHNPETLYGPALSQPNYDYAPLYQDQPEVTKDCCEGPKYRVGVHYPSCPYYQ